MASINENSTLNDFQNFIEKVYGFSNRRDFNTLDIAINVDRFAMRALKGIRKKDYDKTKKNLLISVSWFGSLANQMCINIENKIQKRFPYQCSYCASCPCVCKEKRGKKSTKINLNQKLLPRKINDFQEMFEKIYPSKKRTLEDAGIHLAEESGELLEAVMSFLGKHEKEDLKKAEDEFADFFSCLIAVLNSLKINLAEELANEFYDNCHVCHKMPCQCKYENIVNYKS
jgi:NTP pyrophosphatase (non-canonical NTP hydrolase)